VEIDMKQQTLKLVLEGEVLRYRWDGHTAVLLTNPHNCSAPGTEHPEVPPPARSWLERWAATWLGGPGIIGWLEGPVPR
jgi:hypothetical protein